LTCTHSSHEGASSKPPDPIISQSGPELVVVDVVFTLDACKSCQNWEKLTRTLNGKRKEDEDEEENEHMKRQMRREMPPLSCHVI
jgi:hypothetical protein